MAVPMKKFRGLGPQDMRVQEDCLEINWTEKDTCIKCERSGKLLVCCDSGCPIAVHEKCMGCRAQFDDMGNFYCPYCSYKRAVAESSRARENAMSAKNALSIFIDKEIVDGDREKQKTGTAKRKEFTPSTVARSNNENMPESNAFHTQSVQLEEDYQELALGPEITRGNLPCKGADESLGNKQNEVSLNKCSDNANLEDCAAHRMVVEHQTQSEPVVACDSDGLCCGEKGTTNECGINEVSKRLQVEHQRQVDDNKHERVVEDEQDAEHLSAYPVEEETTLDGELHILTKEKVNDAQIFEKNEDRRAEEQMQEQALQTTVPVTCGEPAVQVHSKDIRGAETRDLICRGAQTVSMQVSGAKEKDKNVVHPLNVASPRGSSRKSSSELRISTFQNEKIITSSKSRQPEKPSKQLTIIPIPSLRRKKLPWRDEEEEMLKEGVQKFSTTVNKNIPWRKILEFGRHVFDGTRTPVDLKDKWRNILAKECSKG